MAIRAGLTPNLPRVQDDENVRQNIAAFQAGVDTAYRTNVSLPKDGTEPFEAPLPFQPLATADLPPAADHTGATVFDTTRGVLVTSNGSAWVAPPTSAEDIEAAQDAVGTILADSATIDFTYADATPSITAVVKPDSIDASHIAANAIGTSELASTAVTPGSYTHASVTVDADGRLTAAANGSVTAPGLVLLASGTVAAASLDLPLGAYTAYRGIIIKLYGIVPATDAATLVARLSTDNGVSWIASAYNWAQNWNTDVPATAPQGNGSDTAIALTGTPHPVGNGAAEGYNGEVELLGWQLSTIWPRIRFSGYHISSDATPSGVYTDGGGANETAQDATGIQFFFSVGNIASGNYAVYGLL